MTRKQVGWVRSVRVGMQYSWVAMTPPISPHEKLDAAGMLKKMGYVDPITENSYRGFSTMVLPEGETPWLARSYG